MECYATHWAGKKFFSLQHIMASSLNLMLFVCLSCSLLPACPPANVGGRQWGHFSCQPEASLAQSYRGNFQFWGIFWGKALVNKLWPLLYKRAELDLRLTKDVLVILSQLMLSHSDSFLCSKKFFRLNRVTLLSMKFLLNYLK